MLAGGLLVFETASDLIRPVPATDAWKEQKIIRVWKSLRLLEKDMAKVRHQIEKALAERYFLVAVASRSQRLPWMSCAKLRNKRRMT